MEMNLYRCPVCGFVHFVPAYWSSFAPDPEVELAHISLESGDDCPNIKLVLQKSDSQE